MITVVVTVLATIAVLTLIGSATSTHTHIIAARSPERWTETGREVTIACTCGKTCNVERLHDGTERMTRPWQ